MAAHPDFHIRYHPDDWSITSDHHHHVDRALHPVVVQLIQWVYFSLLLLSLGQKLQGTFDLAYPRLCSKTRANPRIGELLQSKS